MKAIFFCSCISDYVNDRMYWVDGKLHLIGASDLNGARRANIMTGDKTVGHPFAITAFGVSKVNGFVLTNCEA